ncbi:hypothetical protein ACFX14_022596 [Malus domestica]
MHESVLSFVESLEPPGVHSDSLRPDATLRAVSMLCIAFCSYPETNLSLSIFRQMYAWMPWVFQQAKQGISVALDISIYLEGIHSMLLLQSPLMMESMEFKKKKKAGIERMTTKFKIWFHRWYWQCGKERGRR